MSDERGYQVLDYVEFLESKFAERASPAGNAFTRFTEAVEDKLRAGKVSASAIAETMGLLNRAANVLSGAVAAGKSVATDIVTAAQSATTTTTAAAPRSASGTPASAAATAPPGPPQSSTAPGSPAGPAASEPPRAPGNAA